ncbi:MAG TPA: hypothetical protein VKO45_08915 [Methanomicrobiales archaeon]|nr:hypothetical protein [Methanomicrobiales archaeon]
MPTSSRESGLSEIVGFILILAAIVMAVTLYATFGIPAQGREGEIAHMNEVKDRFVEFKVNVDSLWSNRQCGTAIGTSFTLGTGGGSATGSFSIIPILSPVRTTATLALNQRVEYINVTQDSLFMTDDPAQSWNESNFFSTTPGGITFSSAPRYFLINLTSINIGQSHGVHLYPSSGSAWDAWVNVTPVFWNRSDVTVSTQTGGVSLMQGFIVFKNITSSPSVYVVDLMNPAYGLNTALGAPQTITGVKNDDSITASYLTNYSYWPSVKSQNWNMGCLEYRGQNEYWIPQTYYYQLGGVFLEQNDGNTVKVPPSISLSYSSGMPAVQINEILLDGSGRIEGSGPVQVTSTLSSITNTQLASGNNTRFVNISILAQSNNASLMWQQAFQTAATKAGFPSSIYTTNSSGLWSYLTVSASPNYGIRLSLSRTVLRTAIQTATPAGG